MMMSGRLVLTLPIAEIAIGERIGFYHADHAARIGASMEAEGQHAPVQVRRNGNAAKQPWTLIAGLHRLRGAMGIGWSEIAAIQIAGGDTSGADLRRMELAENLGQKHRRPIERAIMMAEHALLEEAIDHPDSVGEASQVRAAKKRWKSTTSNAEDIVSSASMDTSATVADVEGWRARTAAAFDCSVKSLQRHERLHRAIVEALPDLAEALNNHPLGESLTAMGRLAKIKRVEARRAAAEMLLSRLDWKSMEEMLVAAELKASTGYSVPDRSKLMDAWNKWSLQERKAYSEWIAEKVTPGMAIEMVARFKRRGLL